MSNHTAASVVFRCLPFTRPVTKSVLPYQDTICVLIALEKRGQEWRDGGMTLWMKQHMVVKERME